MNFTAILSQSTDLDNSLLEFSLEIQVLTLQIVIYNVFVMLRALVLHRLGQC